MKKILLLTVFILTQGLTKNLQAQYVTVADPNFAAWLTSNFPTCMNGSQLDTTCNEILNITHLELPASNIDSFTNISEIKYFDNLQQLIVLENYIHTLEGFPVGLKKIKIKGNQILNLPALPPSLDSLILSNFPPSNNIEFIVFPDSLTHIELWYDNLYNLPLLPPNLYTLDVRGNPFTNSASSFFLSNLPNSLNTLNVDYCELMGIVQLPPNLQNLSCIGNQIYNLPNLPSSLVNLDCSNNNIGQLPSLPVYLATLDISYNNISSLPDTLPTLLVVLKMADNQIDSIPSIPPILVTLAADGNPITELPSNISTSQLQYLSCASCSLSYLPSTQPPLNFLNCSNNQITCVGQISSNLTTAVQLDLSNNPFVCISNYVPAMDSTFIANHPLCLLNNILINPFNCQQSYGIVGKTFEDQNQNCIYDAGDASLSNIKVKFFNSINNQFYTTYSGNGTYNLMLPYSTYILSMDTLLGVYTIDCNNPGIDTTITTNNTNPLVQDVNFSLKCKNGYDLGVQSISMVSGMPFPGQIHQINILAGDLSQWYGLNCAQGTGGQVILTYTGPVNLVGPSALGLTPSVFGNTLTYNINDFGNIDFETAFQLIFITETTAQSGDQVCINVQINSNSAEVNIVNNSLSYCYSVVNSYDPNYKEVYPTNVAPLFQDWLTYTIHFQNLGTAPAINIRVLDTLDANLDAETFEVINYSHYNIVTLMDGILDFRFPNIQLTDSASNPSGSQGFVQYRIKPKANLIAGTQIENTAHIYFDFNPAVVTNTTVNNFVTTVGNPILKQSTNIKIYPNPSTGIFKISAAVNIEVYNIVGELILSENSATSIDLTATPKGMYFVKLNGGRIEKLVKN